MPTKYDIAVIGAGIIGTSVSFIMAKAGYKVLCVDKLPAAGYGSTSYSSAVIRTPYSTLDSTALAWESLNQWRAWENTLKGLGTTPLVEYYEAGMLYLNNGYDEAMENSLAHLTTLGIPWESWTSEQVLERFPGFNMDSYAPPRRPDDPEFGDTNGRKMSGGFWTPDAGYISDPQQAAQNLKEAAEHYGATFRFMSQVTDIIVEDNRVTGIRLGNDGDAVITCGMVLNAAGPHSTQINTMAGVDSDMSVFGRPLRQEVCSLRRPEGFTPTEDQKAIVMDIDAGVYYRTEPSGKFVVGGTEPDCDPLVWLDDPDALDRNPTDNWTAQVYRAALRIPSLDIPDRASGVADLYDVTQDWTPIYDKSKVDGFYLAVGTSGNQFKNGPTVGLMMKSLIEYCESGNDHDAVPCQFKCPLTESTINLGSFSRKRIAKSGIGNVLG